VFLGVVSPLRKVAFRYLMPISPLLALSAAWAWVTVGALLPAAYRRALVAAVAVAAAAVVLPVAPHFAAWTSTIGSLVRREAGIVPLLGADGHDDAALFLWRRAGPGDRVATFCYDDVLRFYWHRVLPARLGEPPKPAPAFGYYRLGDADFVVWARRGPNLPPTLEEFVSHRRPDLEVRALEEVVLRAWDLRAAPAAGRP
jgi:hypothetical protein